MLTEDDLRAALRDCYDPEIQLNIVDLGLVQAIEITPAPGSSPARPQQHIKVSITLTDPPAVTDPSGAFLVEQIQNRLAGLPGVGRVDVDLAPEPQWTPLRISEAGRQQLRALPAVPSPAPAVRAARRTRPPSPRSA